MKIAQNGNVNVENDDQSSKFGVLIILPNNSILNINWKIIEFGWLIILDRRFCGATSCPFYLCRIGNRSLMEDEKHSKTKYLIVDSGDDLTASLSADIQHSPWSIACGWPVLGELGTNIWCLRSARICSDFMLRYNLLHGPWINLRWDHCYLARGIAGTFQSSPFHAQRIVGPLEKMSHFTLDPTSQNEHCRDARNKNDSVYRCPCLEHFNVFHII